MAKRYKTDDLAAFASRVLAEAGAGAAQARTVAEVLIEGDLLGHDTHGLALLGPYQDDLRAGRMLGAGEPIVVSDRPAAVLWDGQRLPGPWLTVLAIEEAQARAKIYGMATVVIRRSHHIACLAAYLERPARAGMLVEIVSSDPSVASVAPYGGTRAVFTPNPIAVGIPAAGDPILIDVSTSITTNGMSGRLKAAGQMFPKPWLLDNLGRPSADPKVFDTNPPGTIQPLGGVDVGHKGFGLALWVEAATGALGGAGRAEPAAGWGANVCVRVSDVAAFGGLDAFNTEMGWLIEACRSNPPADAARPVRLPGHRGLASKRHALADGLALNPLVLSALEKVSAGTGIALPQPAG